MKTAFLAGILLVVAAAAGAQPTIQLRTEVSPREIYIGDPVTCTITVLFSSDVAPSPLDPSLNRGDFELLRYAPKPATEGDKGRSVIVHDLVLTTFSTGTVTLPPFALTFMTSNGQQAEARTEPVQIKVRSLLEEKGDIGSLRPLKGFFNFRSYFWLWLTLGLLAAAALGFFLWRNWRRRVEANRPKEPPRPPEDVAREALRALETSDLLVTGQTKEFYYRLSLLFRRYMEGRYAISALDRTTSELLSELRRFQIQLDAQSRARDFLDNADLVKFAKFTPTPEEIAVDLTRVREFVEMTTPQPAPKEEEPPL